jgi:predicted aspartyl protease
VSTGAKVKILVEAKIENLGDLFNVHRGALPMDQVRCVVVRDAVVDTGTTVLWMPRRLIDQLGLRHWRKRQARTTAGTIWVHEYSAVRLTVQDRDCHTTVFETPDDRPVVIGRITLGTLDLVVDPVGRRLIGNPAHGGEHILELY